MPPRSKKISFRLSTDEYNRLRAACHAKGIRNISELARNSLQHILDEASGLRPPALEHQVRGLREQVDSLSAEVDRISRLVDSRSIQNVDGADLPDSPPRAGCCH